ncbi:dipeptide epimerase [Sphingomonas xinjiangensis]|uniref:Dipeptide epimerase n=1 Tax=Sphingomonas xinjiangensis TaxID=643568 RepID=A0A840YPB2_9SPHN|nr:dipeptide epimerase [Sphingomonas xinjiangensis]MBB5709961.1 L-alanine-DL-glutamate epimerase-like enolase superfamily enzyme [Sphingomonas xinjiangensis]
MVMRLSLDVAVERLPFARPFRIAGHVFTESPVVVVTLSDGLHTGRGEASGVYYLGDDADAMMAALETVRQDVQNGMTRAQLQQALPPGGARNALDCAWWELEAKQAGAPVWKLAGLPEPKPLLTTFTLGAEGPTAMAETARSYAHARALKLKLTGDLALDSARVRAVSAARADCWIGVDANQGYDVAELEPLLAVLVECGVALLEQPLARGAEADLDGFNSPIPIAADESALALDDLNELVGRFDTVNIKLDKCGGLTEAIAIARRARTLGLDVMVGNMVGSSLAMAPAFLLGQLCDVVDLDGPIFLAGDRQPGIRYEDGYIHCPEPVWGHRSVASQQNRNIV